MICQGEFGVMANGSTKKICSKCKISYSFLTTCIYVTTTIYKCSHSN